MIGGLLLRLSKRPSASAHAAAHSMPSFGSSCCSGALILLWASVIPPWRYTPPSCCYPYPCVSGDSAGPWCCPHSPDCVPCPGCFLEPGLALERASIGSCLQNFPPHPPLLPASSSHTILKQLGNSSEFIYTCELSVQVSISFLCGCPSDHSFRFTRSLRYVNCNIFFRILCFKQETKPG